jgi:tricorn protease
VDLKEWTFTVVPTEEFHEMFLDAWRLHRDYFYDRDMHHLDWKAVREKYLPLVDRVRDRDELSDLIAQMVSELSALHTFVGGGDLRRGPDQVQLAALGARLERDTASKGYVVRHVYQSDPDRPDKRAPLARPGVDVSDGDVIVSVNGRDVLSAPDIGELLRNEAGRQALLRVHPAGKNDTRDVIVKPMTMEQEADLRYGEWEYTRRMRVEEAGGGQVGYVHLRAMGVNDINQWAEQFYPVFDRQGLIIDVRHNGGGNIDSWILGKLIGTRTWGGEIWLSASNVLADRGIATAAEMGVYGPDGKWLIEGHGVDPDIVVDNLPNATFGGKDAQLEAALSYVKGLIKEKPVPVPPHPPYPDKNFTKSNARNAGGGR